MSETDRILDKLDRMDEKLDDTRETVASISTRMEFACTRDDLSQAIHTHVRDKHTKKPINWKPIIVGIGALFTAAATAIAAAFS